MQLLNTFYTYNFVLSENIKYCFDNITLSKKTFQIIPTDICNLIYNYIICPYCNILCDENNICWCNML